MRLHEVTGSLRGDERVPRRGIGVGCDVERHRRVRCRSRAAS
jgi:hypothetical protein